MATPNEIIKPIENLNAFERCGVHFLQTVKTPIGLGVVQGILRSEDGSLKVIVSHKPDVLPPEPVPVSRMWVLRYYDPADLR